MMKKRAILTMLFLFAMLGESLAFPNCYVYKEDENCYKACKEAEEAVKYPQGSRLSQFHFQESVKLCPQFAYSFFESAVPFAKRGQMHLWIDLINKAVELEPEFYLAQRGWYHWFFMHNYELAIADIDRLDAMVSYDIGETGDGFYHLNVMKGLCYKGLGNYEKAIEVIEECMAGPEYYERPFDHIHLGVLYMEVGRLDEALAELEKQKAFNDVSEAYYYSAKVYQQQGDTAKAQAALQEALDKYDQGYSMHNPYRQLMDKIYRLDIEEAIAEMTNKGN